MSLAQARAAVKPSGSEGVESPQDSPGHAAGDQSSGPNIAKPACVCFIGLSSWPGRLGSHGLRCQPPAADCRGDRMFLLAAEQVSRSDSCQEAVFAGC